MNKVETKSRNITLKQITCEWLEEQRAVLSKNSYAVYKSEIYKYIVPSLGKVRA